MKSFISKVFLFHVIPILLVFSIEYLSRIAEVPKITHFNTNAKAQNLIPKIDSNTVVLLGDSRIEWGIRPMLLQDFQADPNLKIVNLAMPNSNGLDIINYLINNKINPKLIVVGYTSNYWLYNNFNFDRSRLNLLNKGYYNAKHFFKRSFYVSDKSLIKYFKSEDIYFKTIRHDKYGGGYVEEYGDYEDRLDFQKGFYAKWRDDFIKEKLNEFCDSLNDRISMLQEKTNFVGIYMPVSKAIFKIENSDSLLVKNIGFDKFYDLSKFTYEEEKLNHDSVFFLDGSHLAKVYADSFTLKFGQMLINDNYLNDVEMNVKTK